MWCGECWELVLSPPYFRTIYLMWKLCFSRSESWNFMLNTYKSHWNRSPMEGPEKSKEMLQDECGWMKRKFQQSNGIFVLFIYSLRRKRKLCSYWCFPCSRLYLHMDHTANSSFAAFHRLKNSHSFFTRNGNRDTEFHSCLYCEKDFFISLQPDVENNCHSVDKRRINILSVINISFWVLFRNQYIFLLLQPSLPGWQL
jgi:hypothetical protein